MKMIEERVKTSNEDFALDLGCGSGDLELPLARRARDVVALDISTPSVRVAKKCFGECHFVIADAELIPFKEKTFDKVFAFEVIEHLPCAQCALMEIQRVMKAGGYLILHQQYMADFYAILWHRLKVRLGLEHSKISSVEKQHINRYAPQGWAEVLKKCGFIIEHLLPTSIIPLVPLYPLFSYLFPSISPRFLDIPLFSLIDRLLIKFSSINRRLALANIFIAKKVPSEENESSGERENVGSTDVLEPSKHFANIGRQS